MVEALTDNRNRTGPEMKKIFETRGGSLGTSGCVNWMFKKKGLFTVEAGEIEEEPLLELALEAGADDVELNDDMYEITCSVETFEQVKNTLLEKEISTKVAEISQVPSSYVVLDENGSRKILDLMEALEDHDDVQNVYANFDIPDDYVETD